MLFLLRFFGTFLVRLMVMTRWSIGSGAEPSVQSVLQFGSHSVSRKATFEPRGLTFFARLNRWTAGLRFSRGNKQHSLSSPRWLMIVFVVRDISPAKLVEVLLSTILMELSPKSRSSEALWKCLAKVSSSTTSNSTSIDNNRRSVERTSKRSVSVLPNQCELGTGARRWFPRVEIRAVLTNAEPTKTKEALLASAVVVTNFTWARNEPLPIPTKQWISWTSRSMTTSRSSSESSRRICTKK